MELVDASTGEHLDEGWRLQAAVCGSATCARNSGWRVRLCRDVVGAISEPPVENRAASQQPAGSEIRPYQRRNPLLVGAQHFPPPVPENRAGEVLLHRNFTRLHSFCLWQCEGKKTLVNSCGDFRGIYRRVEFIDAPKIMLLDLAISEFTRVFTS